MPRPRGPEDSFPSPPITPRQEVSGALRWELPVSIAEAKGLLVIRTFDHKGPEMSIRGKAAALLERL